MGMRNNRERKKSTDKEMAVVEKASDLIDYTMDITQDIPKGERFVLTNRIENLILDIYGNLLQANSVYVDFRSMNDMKISINAIKNKVSKMSAKDDEYYHLQNKLLQLRLSMTQRFDDRIEERRSFQNQVIIDIKKLQILIRIAFKRRRITEEKYERVSGLIEDCRLMTGAWIQSDRNRFKY